MVECVSMCNLVLGRISFASKFGRLDCTFRLHQFCYVNKMFTNILMQNYMCANIAKLFVQY